MAAPLRLRASGAAVADEAKVQLESTGPMAYSLTALQPKLGVYRDSFMALRRTARLTPASGRLY